jgi:hypothetical protein
MPSAFDVLIRDHEEVKRMLPELENGPAARPGAGKDQLGQRKTLAERLVIEASGGEAVEQMYFWPAVRERPRTGPARRRGDPPGGGGRGGRDMPDRAPDQQPGKGDA